MYNLAVMNLKTQLGTPHRTMSNSTNEWTNFEESDGYNISLTYTKQEKSFKTDRYYVYHYMLLSETAIVYEDDKSLYMAAVLI